MKSVKLVACLFFSSWAGYSVAFHGVSFQSAKVRAFSHQNKRRPYAAALVSSFHSLRQSPVILSLAKIDNNQDELKADVEAAFQAASMALDEAEREKRHHSTKEEEVEQSSAYVVLEAIEDEIDASLQAAQLIILGQQPDRNGNMYFANDADVDMVSQSASDLDVFLQEKQAEAQILKARIRKAERKLRAHEKLITAIAIASDGFILGAMLGVATWNGLPDIIGDKMHPAVPALILGGVMGITGVVGATAGDEWYTVVVQTLLGAGSKTMGGYIASAYNDLVESTQTAVRKSSTAILEVPGKTVHAITTAAERTIDEIGTVAQKTTNVVEKKATETVLTAAKPIVKRKAKLYEASEERRLAQKAIRELKEQARREIMEGVFLKEEVEEAEEEQHQKVEVKPLQLIKEAVNGVVKPASGRVPIPGGGKKRKATRQEAVSKPKSVKPVDSTKKSSGPPQKSSTRTIKKGKRLTAPAGVPTLLNWRVNKDGSLEGVVKGSNVYKDGIEIATNPLGKGEEAEGGVVIKTMAGSKYFLDIKTAPRTAKDKAETDSKAEKESKIIPEIRAFQLIKETVNRDVKPAGRPSIPLSELKKVASDRVPLIAGRVPIPRGGRNQMPTRRVTASTPKRVKPVNATKKSPRPEKSPTITIKKTKRLTAPAGVPALLNWRLNKDGSLEGMIKGSNMYQDGIKVTTSPLGQGEKAEGGFVVKTVTGSKYFLDKKTAPRTAKGGPFSSIFK